MKHVRRDNAAILAAMVLLIVFGNGCAAWQNASTQPQGKTPAVRLIEIEQTYTETLHVLNDLAKANKISPAVGHDIRLAVKGFDIAFAAAEQAVNDPKKPLADTNALIADAQAALTQLFKIRTKVEAQAPAVTPAFGPGGKSSAYVALAAADLRSNYRAHR